MAQKRNPKQVRLFLGMFFALLLLVNAILVTTAAVAGIQSTVPLVGMPTDSSPAVRLLVFIIGAGASWLLGRWVYRTLINGEVSIGESVNASYLLLFYFLLIFAALSFVGVLSWVFLSVLFLVLLLFSILLLWRILGGLFTTGSVVAAFAAAFITFYLMS